MNRSFSVIITIVTMVTMVMPQWKQSAGIFGTQINALAARSNGTGGYALYSGTAGRGVYHSQDTGTTWKHIGLQYHEIRSLMISDSGLFVITKTGGALFHTANDGMTWNTVVPMSSEKEVRCAAQFGNALFIGTNNGIYKSTDNGSTWIASNNGLTISWVKEFAVIGDMIFTVTGEKGVFRSTNNGELWTAVGPEISEFYFESLNAFGSHLYARTYNNIYHTSDNGAHWTSIKNSLPAEYFTSMTVSGSALFLGTERYGVFRTTNNGIEWIPVNAGMSSYTPPPVTSMLTVANMVLAGTYIGVMRSSNNGTLWRDSNIGFPHRYIVAAANIHASDGTAQLLAGGDYGEVYRSIDSAKTWDARRIGVYNNVTSISSTSGPGDTVRIFAGTGGDGIFRSVNGGVEWSNIVQFRTVDALKAFSTTILAGVRYGGVIRSTDHGATWTNVNVGLPDDLINFYVYGFAAIDADIFMATGSGVYRTTNNGDSWTTVNAGLTYKNITSFTSNGATLLAGTGGYGVFRSTNKGESWLSASVGLSGNLVSSLTHHGHYFFASILEQGIFWSSNQGSSWMNISTGLPAKSAASTMVSHNSALFIHTADGFWRRPLSEITSVQSVSSIHRSYSLDQNFPNPFNPSTIVPYHLKKSGTVSIKIYDLLGREIASLVNEYRDAGSYSERWDAHGFSSGTYLMRMESGNYSDTKRIVLMK